MPPAFNRARFLAALICLEVEPPITAESIVRAYRAKARACHPDHAPASERAAATRRMQAVNDARDYLAAHLSDALDFSWFDQSGGDRSAASASPLRWTREECVRACAEYEGIWPADPRD